MMQIRRVVTGHDASGNAVFVADDDVDATSAVLTSTTYHQLWRGDTEPIFPNSGMNGRLSTFFPRPGGYRFFILTVPPGDGHGDLDGVDIEAGVRELEEKFPGMIETTEIENPGMHTTDTVDMEIMLSGELILELDNGAEKTLRAGDVAIQNGTRHRWHNRSDEPAVMLVAMVGGTRR
jgi:quercetin dioxygenase-like cupin family protein